MFLNKASAQLVACPTVNAGPDVNLTCGNNCTTLQATYIHAGSTTSYDVSSITYNPIAPFNAGTPIIIGIDDRWSALLPLPFPFCFFGTTYTNVTAGSNGILSFDNNAIWPNFCWWDLNTTPLPIPTTAYGLGTYPAIMGPYQDIDPTFQGLIAWEVIDATPCRKFVLNFYQIPYFGDPNSVSTMWCPSPLFATSQIVLYETTNVIDIIIQNKEVCPVWNGGRAIEGIQNATGTVAFAVPGRNNTVFTCSNDAWRFTPNAAPSMVSLLWLDSLSNVLGTADSLTVCPTTTTTYTLNAHYSNCPGATTVDVSDQVTVTPSGTLQTSINSVQNITCFGANNGSASVNINIGSPPYTYSWTPSGGNGPTASNLNTGNYTVSITDASGCINILPVTITQPPLLTANNSTPTNVSCFNGSDGVVSVAVAGGTPNYIYLWSPSGGNGATASNLTAGNYTVTVTDANGCTATSTTTIAHPTVLTALAYTVTNVSCFLGSNGSATVNPGGGTGPYTYLWSPAGGNTITANSLSAGTFTITVTDAHGCTITSTTLITQPTVLAAVGSTVTNVLCNGDNNGSTTLAASGGTGPYAYAWSPAGGNGVTANNLGAGSYTVTVTDADGCAVTSTASVTQPALLAEVTATISNEACFNGLNGSATVAVNGGTGPYVYSWSPSGGNAVTANTLGAGMYTITVTDADGCSQTAMVTITAPPLLIANAVTLTNISCSNSSNGMASVNAVGGTGSYSYLWSPSGGTGTTASNLNGNTYTVTVTDGNGCAQTATTTVSQTNSITANISSPTNVSCNGGNDGQAIVNAGGGSGPGTYIYVWTPTGGNSATAAGLIVGDYTVTVTDANGCSEIAFTTVTEPSVLTSVIPASTDILCNGGNNGSAYVSPAGGTTGYNYLWTPSGGNALTASNLTAGIYSVIVTDANGCVTSSGVTINEPPFLASMIGFSANVSCNGGTDGSASVNVAGGVGVYTYSWLPSGGNGTTANNLPANTYTVVVADSHGCLASTSIVITEPTVLASAINDSASVTCNGGNNGSASVLANGGTPPYNYSWSSIGGSTATASNLTAGNYSVTVTDANWCSVISTVTIAEPTPVTLTVGAATTICINQTATITAVPAGGIMPYAYLWSNGPTTASQTVSPTTTSSYDVQVTDANSCTITQTVTVNVNPPLNVAANATPQICAGSNGTVSSTGGGGNGGPYSYAWSNGQTSSSFSDNPSSTTVYTVTIDDGCSPPVQTTTTINVNSVPVVSLTPLNAESCIPTSVDFTSDTVAGLSGSNYLWNFGDGTSSTSSNPSHVYFNAGQYSVSLTITTSSGCVNDTNIINLVTADAIPTADFSVQEEVVMEDPNGVPVIFANTSTASEEWNWDFGDNGSSTVFNPSHIYTDTGSYTIQLISTSTAGCRDTTYRVIHVEGELVIFIPNAFTPNGDGVNDKFNAYGIYVKDFDMWILDRWGGKIYHSTNLNDPWNGTYYNDGTLCQNGVYEYVIRAHDFSGKLHEYVGRISLVR